MNKKILLSLVFSISLLSFTPAMAEIDKSSEDSNQNTILPFDNATVSSSSESASTVLSFSSSTLVDTLSKTTTIGNTITLDIFETNDGSVPLTVPFVSSDNPICEPVFLSGDENNDGVLNPGEQWHYSCDVVSAITGIFRIVLTGFGTAPDGSIVTWPDDPQERIIGTVEFVNDSDSPRSLKQDALKELSALEADNKKDQNRINKAEKSIRNSLHDKLWQDDYTLTKHGTKVFNFEKKAVKLLLGVNSLDVSNIISNLVEADKLLAQGAIDSVPTDSDNKKVDRFLEKANKEMKKAQEDIEEGEPDDAINHYKKAWKYAQNALRYL